MSGAPGHEGSHMYAVIGVWEMDPAKRQDQLDGLDGMVAGVAQVPGLVKGYWSNGSEPSRSHTFIVFSDLQAAEEFAANVRGNVENQARAGVTNVSLDLVTVVATT